NADESLFPNQFVNARLLVKTLHDVTIVPASAIQHNGNATFVYEIRDGHAKVQNVKVGVSEADRTQVEGVTDGAQLADSSFEKLHDGSAVAIAERGSGS